MRTSTIRKMWRDLESKGRVGEDKRRCVESIESEDTSRDANEIENECPKNQNQIANNVQVDDKSLCLHRSPSLDFPAKERVRKVFRDWGSRSFECKRVRIEMGSQIGDGSVVDLGVCGKRSICRIYGRQAVLDLLAKFVTERKREVECLLENQFVSNFAHRHRIQSLLKGRFLRNQRFVQVEKQSSVAASELGLLRQTHSVSDIRKGFLSRLKPSDSDNEIKYEEAYEIVDTCPNPQEFASPVVMQSHHLQTSSEMTHETEKLPDTVVFIETKIQNQDDSDTSNLEHVNLEEEWHESVTEDDDSEWHHLTSDESEGIDVNSPLTSESRESNQDWYDNNVTPKSWFDRNYSGRSNTFDWSDDDDNDRKLELTQLSNRKTVSNLLQSDFGPRLDNLLMQSYVQRQNQAFDNDSLIPQRQHESEIINGLRIDINNLQQRMNEMQTMLETCMNMQQSVHQQLNSALNQSSCHLCCDNDFQSLPDRYGAHMYICSKCVEKINWSKVKESVETPISF